MRMDDKRTPKRILVGLAASRITLSGNYMLRRPKCSKNEVVVPKEEEEENIRVETYRYKNQRETKEEMDCRYRRRYANNGNKTVEKPM